MPIYILKINILRYIQKKGFVKEGCKQKESANSFQTWKYLVVQFGRFKESYYLTPINEFVNMYLKTWVISFYVE